MDNQFIVIHSLRFRLRIEVPGYPRYLVKIINI